MFPKFPRLPSSSNEFKNIILFEVINGLKFNTFLDNFDGERFNIDSIDRSRIFDTADRVLQLDWFFKNFEYLYAAFTLFEAVRSKQLFLNLIAFRIAGHHSIRIETIFDENCGLFEAYKAIETYTESKLPAVGVFGRLRHYNFIYNSKRYVADCLGFKAYLYRRQYFFKDGATLIEPEKGDFVIDAGACLGDTAIVFGKTVGSEGRVFAFDPVYDHLEILIHNIKQNPDCNVSALPFGLANVDANYNPIKLQSYAPGFSAISQNCPLRRLDTFVIESSLSKIDYIKMDIEGSELSALIGATHSIKTFRPKLAISLYHRPNDLYEIPLYIHQQFPFYQMYVEHYSIHNEETVLYCIPR